MSDGTITFKKVNILNLETLKLIYITDITDITDKINFTLVVEIMATEYNMFYAIIPISENTMNNTELNIDVDTTYTKEYIKKLIIDGKLTIGISDHFCKKDIIKIMDKEESDYIISYFSLSDKEKDNHEWREFTSYLD